MYHRRSLVNSLEDMEPNTFDSMRKVAKDIVVGYATIRYVRDSRRDLIKRFKSGSIKMFFIKW